MQFDLQATSHSPHFMQLSLIIPILKNDILDNNPKKVPTGQIVLQYNLPNLKLSNKTNPNINIENNNAKILIPLNSIGEIAYKLNDSKVKAIILFVPIIIGLTIFVNILPKLLYGSSKFRPIEVPKRRVRNAIIKKK